MTASSLAAEVLGWCDMVNKRHRSVKTRTARRKSLARRWSLSGYLFCLPWMAGFLAFTVYPLIYSLFLTGNQVKIGGQGIITRPIGLGNFVYALTMDVQFYMDMAEAIRTFLVMVPLIIILSMMIGIMLSQRIRMKGFFRAVYFFPVIIMSGSLVTTLKENDVFKIVELSQSLVLRWMRMEGFGFFLTIVTFLLDNIFSVLWFSGTQILIYMAGMQKIDRGIYEAASIDGASGWQSFWKITLPALRQFTVLNIFYTIVIIGTFSENPLLVRLRKLMIGNGEFEGYGYASTQAWLYFALMVLVLGFFLLLVREKRRGKEAKAAWKK